MTAGYLSYIGFDLMQALALLKEKRPEVEPFMATFNSVSKLLGYEAWIDGTR
jgi:hypothetical protein